MAITTVFFDLGETLVDETRYWRQWADYLEVPFEGFLSVLHQAIAEGRHHRDAFTYFRPDFDLAEALQARKAAGTDYVLSHSDFYEDALPCLKALRAAGYKTGIAGNQPKQIEAHLRRLDLETDFIATSEGLGVEKPNVAFFRKICELANCPENSMAYVGDRIDNDVMPAIALGLTGIFLVRGPWAKFQESTIGCPPGVERIRALSELIPALQ